MLYLSSQIILLSACPGVLVQPPLDIAILILQCASTDLEAPHRHPRPHLSQFDTLVSSLYKDMVSNFDTIIDVFECHNSTSNFRSVCNGFSRREYML